MNLEKNIYCGCLYYSANAFARKIGKMADEKFSVTGLSSSYAFLVMTINSNPGIQPSSLAEIMQLTPSTVTRLLEKLEFKGLIERKSEGKFIFVYPTNNAVDLDPKIKEAWMKLYNSYTKVLGIEFSNELSEMISKANVKMDR